jgi:hypothetical protein
MMMQQNETRKRWSQEKKGCSRENNLCASSSPEAVERVVN